MRHEAHSPSMNVLVVGWYGAPNVGDEVLLEVLKTAVESRGGTIIVASVDPALTREMHDVESVDFHNLGELARTLLWANVLIMGGGGSFRITILSIYTRSTTRLPVTFHRMRARYSWRASLAYRY